MLSTIPQIHLHAELSLSRLVYGAWRLSEDNDTSTAHIRAKIDACLQQGITSFDHADIYGNYSCETLFGKVLAAAPSLREHMQLITKCDIMLTSNHYPERRIKYYDTSPQHIEYSVNNSLSRLHTDYLDLLLIHRPDPFMDAQATGKALDQLIDSGKVRAVGVSNFKTWDWDLLQSAMHHRLVTNQIEISLLERNSFHDGTLAQLQRLNVKPMAWSPLAGGRLLHTNANTQALQSVMQRIAHTQQTTIDQVALAWLLTHPAQIIPIIGTNQLARILDSHKAFNIPMDRQTWFELLTAAQGQEVP